MLPGARGQGGPGTLPALNLDSFPNGPQSGDRGPGPAASPSLPQRFGKRRKAVPNLLPGIQGGWGLFLITGFALPSRPVSARVVYKPALPRSATSPSLLTPNTGRTAQLGQIRVPSGRREVGAADGGNYSLNKALAFVPPFAFSIHYLV